MEELIESRDSRSDDLALNWLCFVAYELNIVIIASVVDKGRIKTRNKEN